MSDPVEYVDKTPICPWCNQQMESTGQYREIELDGGEFTVIEEVYECRDCEYDDQVERDEYYG